MFMSSRLTMRIKRMSFWSQFLRLLPARTQWIFWDSGARSVSFSLKCTQSNFRHHYQSGLIQSKLKILCLYLPFRTNKDQVHNSHEQMNLKNKVYDDVQAARMQGTSATNSILMSIPPAISPLSLLPSHYCRSWSFLFIDSESTN